jgi:LmbE family N-acetylglucosaminyl deacetylase
MTSSSRVVLFFAILVLLSPVARAQDSAGLRQAFLDLSNPLVAMDLSAHPDDEDGATLAYLHWGLGVKTYSVLFTRGEGGQNEKGPELYEKLGVLRSRETEEAGKILGAEVRFLNFMDFGFSKTSTETFQKWGGLREVLRRLVYVIRKYKPDILFTNHNTIDGHGNHQAVAITAIAAFDAAADSTWFPEQLREPGITVWQPRKLFFRVWGRSEPTADVSIPILDTNSIRGKAYIDIASEALRKHRTQGMERANLRGFTRGRGMYKLMRENSLYESDSTSFFSGIDLWRDPSLAPLHLISDELVKWHPSMARDSLLRSASSLLQQLGTLEGDGNASPLARRMEARWQSEIERIVALSCGVKASLALSDSIVVARQQVACHLHLTSADCTLGNVRVQFALPGGWKVGETKGQIRRDASGGASRTFTLVIGNHVLPTLPKEVAQYNSLERQQDVTAHIDYTLDGVPVSIQVAPAFEVAPPQWISVEPEVSAYLPGRSVGDLTYSWTLTNFLPHGIHGDITARVPAGWSATSVPYEVGKEDATATGRIAVRLPHGVKVGEYAVEVQGAEASASVPVSVFDVKVADNLNLGIITSYDNTLVAAASELHVPYHLVSDAEIEHADLGRFTSIIVDIRAYLVRDALKGFNGRLLDYVRNGGNLIVMYQRDQEWKPEYAPYPFQITRRRVTVEEAPVTMLVPDHPLMSVPNRIGEQDWKGWKQERGLYFPGHVAPEYTRLLSSSDPDEEPLTTGYLVATFGKGSYIYTSYVWYRQLKEENPGAFRCFANMISYSATRK